MDINISVSEVTLDSMVAKAMEWDQEDQSMVPTGDEVTIGTLVAQQIVEKAIKDDRYPQLKDQVLTIRAELLREKLTPMIEEALARPLRKTNSYGEPTGGAEVTFSEMVIAEVQRIMTQPSDNYRRENGTMLQVLVRDAVAEMFKTTVTAELAKVQEMVQAQVAEQLAKRVTASVTKP